MHFFPEIAPHILRNFARFQDLPVLVSQIIGNSDSHM